MRWTRKVVATAIGLASIAQVAQAQVTVNYSTTGSFSGLCTGLSCSIGGMLISFNPLSSNSVTLDSNNGFYSFLSFGEFAVSGSRVGQQSFAGVSFALTITQNMPLAGGPQILAGQFTGGIDANSSNLKWNRAPAAWSLPWGASQTIDYTSASFTNLQAPSSNLGVTSIQGDVSTNVVPEPASMVLVAVGLSGLLLAARHRRSA